MHEVQTDGHDHQAPTYSAESFSREIPKLDIPRDGLDAEVAYQLVHDELNLDGNPALNLASFVTSWMEPAADRLAVETLNKNMIDQDEYPRTEAIHERVVTMLGRLFHAPPDRTPVGTATIGSSEAIMLALLAHKRTWQLRRRAAGLPDDRPNLVVGADVHTCWEKFARYFEVEARVAPMRDGAYTLSAADVASRIDERTIAVGGLLGTTFTGQMDELGPINDVLAETRARDGWEIALHIDAASGGFIIPFSQPDLAWDFRLSEVRSINVSNHKFGLVYPGMGTVIFRDRSDLPAELVFHINYLGGDMPNYSLNFSRPSSSVVLQYYNFLRLGRSGYERIVGSVLENAQTLAARLGQTGRFEVINDAGDFPIVAVSARRGEDLDLRLLSRRLREKGWIVPAYSLPADAEHVTVLRMVVKESFSRDMVDLLADDIEAAIGELCQPTPADRDPSPGVPPPAAERERPIC
jgi:glutamate decarboxylase